MTEFTTLKGFEKFQLDPARCGDGLILSNRNTVVTATNGLWRSVFAKNMISTETMTRLRWEILLRGKAFGCDGRVYLGIMDAQYIDEAYTINWIGNQHHQMAFTIWEILLRGKAFGCDGRVYMGIMDAQYIDE